MRTKSVQSKLSCWIPVGDARKPEDGQDVLLVIDMRAKYPKQEPSMVYFITRGWYSAKSDAFGDADDPGNGAYATYWLPIPPLP